jgi:TRAP-type C4-dicarboxylate transport system permease small subunit
MGILVFGGLPLVSRRNAHMRAGFFDNVFRGRTVAVRESVVTAASALACGAWTWLLARQAAEMQASGELLGTVPLKVGILVWGMTGLAAVSTALLLMHLPHAWAGQSREQINPPLDIAAEHTSAEPVAGAPTERPR